MNAFCRKPLFTAALFGLLASGPVLAADPGEQPSDDWTVTLGASAILAPRFPGAKGYDSIPIPTFDIRRFGTPEVRSAPDDNPSLALLNISGFEIGPVAGFRDGRSTSDTKALAGIHTIDWDVDAGIFLQYWAVQDTWRFRTEFRQAVSNGSGLVIDVGSDWFYQPFDGWTISAGPRASFGDGAYMKSYFGVTSGDAARNGRLSSFDTSGGLKSVGLTVSVSHKIDPDWSIHVYDRFDRMVGDAADSPIIARIGDANQNIVGITLKKSFNIKF